MYIGKVEKKSLILSQRPYMPSGSSRITSTRIRPKMPASTPGFLRKSPIASPSTPIGAMPVACAASAMLSGIESRRMAISGGSSATKIAPNTAPCSEPSPPTITSSRNWIDSRMVKMSGAR